MKLPLLSNFWIRWLLVSATNMLPFESIAIPYWINKLTITKSIRTPSSDKCSIICKLLNYLIWIISIYDLHIILCICCYIRSTNKRTLNITKRSSRRDKSSILIEFLNCVRTSKWYLLGIHYLLNLLLHLRVEKIDQD
jgi:hypothetical protein